MIKNKIKQISGIMMVLVVSVVFFAVDADAVPSFAAKTGLTCTKCHANFPKLNAFGREFKQNGYVRTGEKESQYELSETLSIDKIPLSFLAKMRPYDDEHGNTHLRAFHELEIFLAGTSGGALGDNISFFTEIEAEDETGYELALQSFELGYHIMPELNIAMGNRPLRDADPMQTLSQHGRVTRSKRAVFNANGSYGSGNSISSKQNVGVDGLLANTVYYGAKYGADVNDPEGQGPADVELRLACKVAKGVTVGAYYNDGKQKNTDTNNVSKNVDFTRTVVDVLAECSYGSIAAAYQIAKDDKFSGSSEENNGYYVEMAYNYLKDGNPLVVPTVRYGAYEKTDGADDYAEVTANLAVFLRENVKAYVEYWKELDKPSGSKDDRTTVQVEVGF